MGHYWSEMQNDGPAPPPKPKVGVADKPRRIEGHGDTPLDAGEIVEFAVDYDQWRGGYSVPGDPVGSHLEPRRFIPSFYNSDEDQERAVKSLKQYYDIKDHGNRPGVIMKRTVTYGEWEVIEETTEKTEGWY